MVCSDITTDLVLRMKSGETLTLEDLMVVILNFERGGNRDAVLRGAESCTVCPSMY